jgi:two-component system NtrC family sensor kinase
MNPIRLIDLIESFLNNRYRVLKLKLFFIIGIIAGAPLILVSLIAYFWLYGIARDDFAIKLSEKLKTASLSIDFYISEKLSGLKFLTYAYSYESLTNKETLNNIFNLFKREFGEMVDIGIIESNGIQRVYAGPFNLTGKDYSSHDWYLKALSKGYYVSDVFSGYRNIPHFAIAVKKNIPSKGSFCILRATIDLDSLTNRIQAMGLKGSEDAFLINNRGVLQTDSRFFGRAMENMDVGLMDYRRAYSKNITISALKDMKGFIGYKRLNSVDWYLVMLTKDSPQDKIIELLRHNYTLVYLVFGVLFVCVVLNFIVSSRLIDWIRTSEKNREEAIARSEHANRLASIGRLAAGVAHEINNPLAIINEKAGLMKDIIDITENVPHREKLLALIAAIAQSVNRCRTITHRLLGFARQMDVNLEMIDINTVIREVLQFLEKEILYRDIRLELDMDNGLPSIESDKGQLQQVFLNIINNAIDAVQEEGFIKIKTFRYNQDSVGVSIRDNGHGIPADKLKQIFEPFYTTKEKGKGTGLGLAITYGIVNKLGGEIKVDSEVGRGTVFTVILPLRVVSKTGDSIL